MRNQFLLGFVLPSYVSTTSQLADLFTEALPATFFRGFLSKMSLLDIHRSHLAGSVEKLQIIIQQEKSGIKNVKVLKNNGLLT